MAMSSNNIIKNLRLTVIIQLLTLNLLIKKKESGSGVTSDFIIYLIRFQISKGRRLITTHERKR